MGDGGVVVVGVGIGVVAVAVSWRGGHGGWLPDILNLKDLLGHKVKDNNSKIATPTPKLQYYKMESLAWWSLMITPSRHPAPRHDTRYSTPEPSQKVFYQLPV